MEIKLENNAPVKALRRSNRSSGRNERADPMVDPLRSILGVKFGILRLTYGQDQALSPRGVIGRHL